MSCPGNLPIVSETGRAALMGEEFDQQKRCGQFLALKVSAVPAVAVVLRLLGRAVAEHVEQVGTLMPGVDRTTDQAELHRAVTAVALHHAVGPGGVSTPRAPPHLR